MKHQSIIGYTYVRSTCRTAAYLNQAMDWSCRPFTPMHGHPPRPRSSKPLEHIIDPLLTEQAELIAEGAVSANPTLRDRMLNDVNCMCDDTKRVILSAMLKMHKEIADYRGDLEISLNSIEEIAEKTESWYAILDAGSTPEIRGVPFRPIQLI